MRKVRLLTVCLGAFLQISSALAQEMFRPVVLPADTMPHLGFSGYREAADTLWSRLAARKASSVLTFTLSDSDYYMLVKKTDTFAYDQMVRGQWIAYWHKVEKSYHKTYRRLRKSRISLARSVRDTLLFRNDAANVNIRMVEIWLSKGKTRGYIRFYLWKFRDEWYYLDKMEFVEDRTRVK